MANQTNRVPIETTTAWVALVAAGIGVFPGAMSALVCWSGLKSENSELRQELTDAKTELVKRDAEFERRFDEFRDGHTKELEDQRKQVAALEQRLDKADAERKAIRYDVTITQPKSDAQSKAEEVVDLQRESHFALREKSNIDWQEVLAGVFLCCIVATSVAVLLVVTASRKRLNVMRRIRLLLKEFLLDPKFMNSLIRKT